MKNFLKPTKVTWWAFGLLVLIFLFIPLLTILFDSIPGVLDIIFFAFVTFPVRLYHAAIENIIASIVILISFYFFASAISYLWRTEDKQYCTAGSILKPTRITWSVFTILTVSNILLYFMGWSVGLERLLTFEALNYILFLQLYGIGLLFGGIEAGYFTDVFEMHIDFLGYILIFVSILSSLAVHYIIASFISKIWCKFKAKNNSGYSDSCS